MTEDHSPVAQAPDSVKEKTKRTIYDASSGEIFGKNFLAGVAHALGQILVYLLFVAGVFTLAARFFLPVIQPYLDIYLNSMESLQLMQSYFPGESSQSQFEERSPSESTQQFSPQQLDQAQQMLQQLQQNQN